MMRRSILCLFGLGRLPHSASFASLAVIPLYYFTCARAEHGSYLNIALFSIILVWSMAELGRFPTLSRTDPREIVVDEFLGMYCTLIIASTLDPFSIGLLFVVFRVVDRFKVFPFNIIENKLGGTYGLLWDDIAIGVSSGLLFVLANRLLS
jgi:phosphatidylglycerophosphatase A